MSLGIIRDQLGEPSIVRHSASPLQFGHSVFGRQSQTRAKGRRVLLCDSVGKDNFGGDPILRQHFCALLIIPSASEFLLDGRAPLIVDLFDQKLLFRLVHHVDLDVHRHVDEIVIFGFDIRLILLDG